MSYDDVPTDEAIDLVRTLPPGSRYVAATDPLGSWPDERHRSADVVDALMVVAWALGAYKADEPPRVVRPRDAWAREVAAGRARAARAQVEDGDWEEA